MEGLRDFPAEFSQPFVMCFDYLRSCNIGMFDDDVPFWRKYWRFAIMSWIVMANFISIIMHMLRMFQSQINVPDLAMLAPMCFIGLQSLLKAVVLFPRKSDIENLIKGVADMWRTANLSDSQIQDRNRRLRILNFSHSIFYYGSQIAVTYNLGHQLVFTVIGKLHHQDFDFILPYGCVLPFDPVKNWTRYLLVYVFQYYSIRRLINYYIAVQMLVCTLCSHISTEFALLREDIKNVVPMPNKPNNLTSVQPTANISMTIETLIQNHQQIIKLAQVLQRTFNEMIFVDLTLFAIIICFFAVGLSVAHDIVYFGLNIVSIIPILIMIYTFCYFCETVKEESLGIADSAYENLWYEGGTHYQNTIKFMIMRAQRPCYMTSLNYANITLNTFTTVVSTTWSYFSLAREIWG